MQESHIPSHKHVIMYVFGYLSSTGVVETTIPPRYWNSCKGVVTNYTLRSPVSAYTPLHMSDTFPTWEYTHVTRT
jgi:hypothetical protein